MCGGKANPGGKAIPGGTADGAAADSGTSFGGAIGDGLVRLFGELSDILGVTRWSLGGSCGLDGLLVVGLWVIE